MQTVMVRVGVCVWGMLRVTEYSFNCFQLRPSPSLSSHITLLHIFSTDSHFPPPHFPISLHLTPFSAPPDSISIQSVGGLAIRPGGLLTVTEDVISQVTVMVIMMMVHSLNQQI